MFFFLFFKLVLKGLSKKNKNIQTHWHFQHHWSPQERRSAGHEGAFRFGRRRERTQLSSSGCTSGQWASSCPISWVDPRVWVLENSQSVSNAFLMWCFLIQYVLWTDKESLLRFVVCVSQKPVRQWVCGPSVHASESGVPENLFFGQSRQGMCFVACALLGNLWGNMMQYGSVSGNLWKFAFSGKVIFPNLLNMHLQWRNLCATSTCFRKIGNAPPVGQPLSWMWFDHAG